MIIVGMHVLVSKAIYSLNLHTAWDRNVRKPTESYQNSFEIPSLSPTCVADLCLIFMLSVKLVKTEWCSIVGAGIENVCMIHVGLVPVMGVVGEQKTKY